MQKCCLILNITLVLNELIYMERKKKKKLFVYNIHLWHSYKVDSISSYSVYSIGLYTPINYFGRYATCSHKDGGHSMFSLGKPLARRTTWYAYNYVGARKFKSCIFEPLTRRVFSINMLSSNTFFLFDQISSRQQHTPFSVNQQERKATPWMGLADIHIQGLRRFPISEKLPVSNHIKGHFKLAILFVA